MSASREENKRLFDDVENGDVPAAHQQRSTSVVFSGYRIPRDVMQVIASHLDLRSIAALSVTNYGLYQLTHSSYWARAMYVQIPGAPVPVSLTDVRHYLQHGFSGERTVARWDAAAKCCGRFSNLLDVWYVWPCAGGALIGTFAGDGTAAGVAMKAGCYQTLSTCQTIAIFTAANVGGCVACGSLACVGTCCMRDVSRKCAESSEAWRLAVEQQLKADPELSKGYWTNYLFKTNPAALKSARLYLLPSNASVEPPARLEMMG